MTHEIKNFLIAAITVTLFAVSGYFTIETWYITIPAILIGSVCLAYFVVKADKWDAFILRLKKRYEENKQYHEDTQKE